MFGILQRTLDCRKAGKWVRAQDKSMVQRSMRYGVVMVFCHMVQYGTVWYGMVRYGMV